MSERRRVFSYLAGGTLALSLAACGGGGPTTPTTVPTPVPTPPPPEVAVQGNISLDPLVLYLRPFSISRAGSLDVTVDWTYAHDDVDVYIAQGDCSFDQFIVMQCNIVGFSESFTAKPEKATVATAAAGTYTLLVGNIGPDLESISYQVVLTPSAAASASRRTAPSTPGWAKVAPREFVEAR